MTRHALILLMAAATAAAQQPADKPIFTYQEVMVPVRDGVHLQTVILTPVDQKGPLPILFRRTPYGVPAAAPAPLAASMKELAADGYIFVIQNLRGRYKSEGNFRVKFGSDLSSPKNTNETTDAYDAIDWLVKNIPNNNGKVGMYGVSYDGYTSGTTLLQPHPALKAISEQASPGDEWMNDDDHRYGALRLSYVLEYTMRMEGTDANPNSRIKFDTYDTYSWYLAHGSLSDIDDKYLHGSLPYWNSVIAHPDYDGFWKSEAWVWQVTGSTVPNLNVAGFWDQEDPWGPWQIFQRAKQHDPDHTNLIVAGPWYHGEWSGAAGDSLGIVSFGGHETGREFRENIEAPFFRYYLHGTGSKPDWQATMFQTGSNRWRTYAAWPPAEAKPTKLYLHADGTLSFDAPRAGDRAPGYREYVSDPSSPVPYRKRPIAPNTGNDWRTWEVTDQRFVDGRPDVLTFVTALLDHDLTITGALAAHLVASTTGSDADFVVKLIDVYPEDVELAAGGGRGADGGAGGRGRGAVDYGRSMNGYQLPIAMEIQRGRYLKSYEHPTPLTPNKPTEWTIPLRDHDHVFLKGHRMMVQVQSSWFPVIDRNPQKFVPNIGKAKASDYVKATQRVYSSPAMASYIMLPVAP
jgi:putative CocE/NonD family hydrolase